MHIKLEEFSDNRKKQAEENWRGTNQIMTDQEKEVCNKIYEENKERLKWYMWKNFPWMNREDIHDVMQETWHKLSKNIAIVGKRDATAQSYWLMKVCHNEAVSFLRKKGSYMHRENEYQQKILESKNSISMEDKVVDKLVTETLLKSMTEEDKQFFLGDANQSEKQVPKSNAENCKTYRARKKLKQRWREGGWDG